MTPETRQKLVAAVRAVAPGLTHGSLVITVHDGRPRRVRVEWETLVPDEPPQAAQSKPPPGKPA